MRVNENTAICGDKVILVPYRSVSRAAHLIVPGLNMYQYEHLTGCPDNPKTYHQWMKSPDLLELTASEPLSYEEELDMQKKWQEDADKLTFILLARPPSLISGKTVLDSDNLRQCPMIGDVNLFLPNGPSDDVECEIMIADSAYRRKGIAREALTLFLSYVIRTLQVNPTHFIARIGAKNEASITLFRALGFGVVKHVAVWDEVELRWGHVADGSTSPSPWDSAQLDGRIGTYSASP